MSDTREKRPWVHATPGPHSFSEHHNGTYWVYRCSGCGHQATTDQLPLHFADCPDRAAKLERVIVAPVAGPHNEEAES